MYGHWFTSTKSLMKRNALFALLALLTGIYFGGCVDIGDNIPISVSCSNSDGCQGDLRCILNVCVESVNSKPLPGPDGKPLVNACGDAACGVDPFGNVCGTCSARRTSVLEECVEATAVLTGFAPTAQAALIRRSEVRTGPLHRDIWIRISVRQAGHEFDHEKMLESGSPTLVRSIFLWIYQTQR